MQRRAREREELLKRSDPGLIELLILQRQALEENLKLLSDEVESLSHCNSRMLKELKVREFYPEYNQAI